MALPQRKQNFMEGAAVLTLAVAVTKVLGAVYKIPLGNLLDKDGMAHFYVAYNIYSLLLIVSTAGLPLALSRLVSQAEARGRVNQRKRIFRVTLGLFCLLGVVCSAVMLLFAEPLSRALRDSQAAPAIRVLAPAVFCVCILSAIRGYTQGRGNMLPTAVSQIIESACKLTVGLTVAWLLVRQGTEPGRCAAGAISGVTVGAATGLAVLTVWLLRSRSGQRGTDVPQSRREILRRVLQIGVPVTLGSVGMSLITLLDQALVLGTLQSSLGLSEANAAALYGEYTFGMTLFALPASFMYPLTISLVPSISAATAAGRGEAAAQNAASALKLAMVVALPVGVGMSVLAGPILHLLYPAVPQTAEAAAYHLRILGIASVFVCLMIATAGILQAYGKERIPVITLLVGGGENCRQLPAGDGPGHLHPRRAHRDAAVLRRHCGAESAGHRPGGAPSPGPGRRGGKAPALHRGHGGSGPGRLRPPLPAHGLRVCHAPVHFGGGDGLCPAGAVSGGAAPGGDFAASQGRKIGKISI